MESFWCVLCRKSDSVLLSCIIAKLRRADENNVLSAKAVIISEKPFSMAPQSRNNKTHLITQTYSQYRYWGFLCNFIKLE